MRSAWAVAPMALALHSILDVGPAATQSRWERQVVDGFKQVARALRQEGYVDSGERRGFVLNASERAVFTLNLQGDEAYVLVGVCDEDCLELQLAVYAENDYEIEAARTPTNAPILRIAPRDTGAYRVQVVMARCRLNPCWAGAELYQRAAGDR